MTLAILDLGYGNVESVRLGFARLGADPQLVRDVAAVEAADRLVVPGVGHAGYAMQRLADHGLVDAIRERTRPTLGICVGMQLLFEASEEADAPLLAILPGTVTALEAAPSRPVPHMGWSRVETHGDIGLQDGDHLYFAHSFACPDGPATAARTTYGRPIPAAVRQGNFWGAQFHPERSSAPGANYLKAFLAS
ncbi:imidazole glycerol phosphate synthase subunit HisH [Sphingomicrobium flavum]|uniref:imidazole glycerol phosphate synthase subunit HisH n=1 Tax=Sphingomicrobium flavum TaxID=1229164 RepID=UPI0021ADFD35|nr:imidazole glycerol phosphate synthase subunit HisH [Sphingomicrobium flavum]